MLCHIYTVTEPHERSKEETERKFLEMCIMWFSDRRHKGLFMPYFQKQVINYKFLSLIDREFPEKRKGHSWWKTPWPVKKAKYQQTCSEKSSTQGSRELTEYSQCFYAVFSKTHFNILCTVAGFCGLSNKIPDSRFITLSTGRLLLAPQRVWMWRGTVPFAAVSTEQG